MAGTGGLVFFPVHNMCQRELQRLVSMLKPSWWQDLCPFALT